METQEERIARLIKMRDGYANVIARLVAKRERVPLAYKKEYRRLDNIVLIESMVKLLEDERQEAEAYVAR